MLELFEMDPTDICNESYSVKKGKLPLLENANLSEPHMTLQDTKTF